MGAPEPHASESNAFLLQACRVLFEPNCAIVPAGVRKNRMKAKEAPRDTYRKLSGDETRLARMWYLENGMGPSEVAGLLRRDKSALTRLLVTNKERKQPLFLSAAGPRLQPACLRGTLQLTHSYHTVTTQLLHSYHTVTT